VLLTAAHVIYLTSTGELLVVTRNVTTFESEHRYDVATSATYAVPLFLSGDLIVRDATGISRMGGA